MKIFLLALYDEWSLGLRLISSILKQEGHHVALATLQSNPEMQGELGKDDPEGYHAPPGSVPGKDFKALLELVKSYGPDLIGIGFTSSFPGLAEKVTHLLRTVSKAPIAWGGVDPTANPDTSILTADIVCIGEGDGAVVDLTRRMAAGQEYTDIPNLWVRKGDQIFKNDIRPLITDLDSLPFADFEPEDKYWISEGQVHVNKYHPKTHLTTNFPIVTTRGCPYSCTYCCNGMYRNLYGGKDYVRMRSVKNVIDELTQYLSKHPEIRWIEIFDDVFGSKQEWVEEFAEEYARKVRLPFWGFTYPAFVKPGLVAAMKKAGVGFIVMGVQSGSQRILKDIYRRNNSNQRVLEAAKMLMDAGIMLLIDLIDGNPFENEEDNWQTLELMLQMPTGFLIQPINPLTFFRNYPLTEIAAQQGYTIPMLPGRNSAVVPRSPECRFWVAILTLTQYASMPKETIRTMAKDPYLREHPEIVEIIANAMEEATYMPGTRILRTERERQIFNEIAELRGELSRLRGSRVVQMALRLRKLTGNTGEDLAFRTFEPLDQEKSARAIGHQG